MGVLGKSRVMADSLSQLFDVAVQKSCTILGFVFGWGPRKIVDREVRRITSCIKVLRSIACVGIGFSRFLDSVRMFAISKVAYGWVSKAMNWSDLSRIWSAVSVASKRLRMASPWLRAVAVLCHSLGWHFGSDEKG